MYDNKHLVGEKTNKNPPLNFETPYPAKTKTSRKATKVTSLVFAILAINAYAALSDTIVQKQFFSGVSNFSTLLTFNKFNMSGTLTSIEIIFNLQIEDGTLVIDNDGGSAVSGTFKFGSMGNIRSTEVNLPDSSSTIHVLYSQIFSLDANDLNDHKGDYDPTPPDGLQYNGNSKNGDVSGLVNSMFWNDYTGTGVYNVVVNISKWVDCGDFDELEYAIVTPIGTSGYVEAVYNYDVIPEPATIILLTVGAFAFLKRKNSK